MGFLDCGFTLADRPCLGLADLFFWPEMLIENPVRKWFLAIQKIFGAAELIMCLEREPQLDALLCLHQPFLFLCLPQFWGSLWANTNPSAHPEEATEVVLQQLSSAELQTRQGAAAGVQRGRSLDSCLSLSCLPALSMCRTWSLSSMLLSLSSSGEFFHSIAISCVLSHGGSAAASSVEIY